MKLALLGPTASLFMSAIAMTSAYAQTYSSGDSWTGAYGGISAGLSTNDSLEFFDENAFVGGAHAGYRMQLGPGVIGAELEGGYSNGQSHATGGNGALEQYWSGAAKLKAGAALGGTMVYGTGGYGVANLESGSAATQEAGWRGGWLFGAGVEQKIGNGMSLGLEYNQTHYNGVETITNGAHYSDDLVNHSVKAGLNLQWHDPGMPALTTLKCRHPLQVRLEG